MEPCFEWFEVHSRNYFQKVFEIFDTYPDKEFCRQEVRERCENTYIRRIQKNIELMKTAI